MRIFGEPNCAAVRSVAGVASLSGIQPLRPDVLTKDLISAGLELPLVAKVHSSIGKAVVMTFWLLLFPISSLPPRPRLHIPRLSLGRCFWDDPSPRSHAVDTYSEGDPGE